jgi:hypothetical protein
MTAFQYSALRTNVEQWLSKPGRAADCTKHQLSNRPSTSKRCTSGQTCSGPAHRGHRYIRARKRAKLPLKHLKRIQSYLAQTQQSCRQGLFRSNSTENGCRRTYRNGSDIRDKLARHGKWRNPVGSDLVVLLLSFATSKVFCGFRGTSSPNGPWRHDCWV